MDLCLSSMAIPLPIAPTTPCRNRFGGSATVAAARSSVSPISCCACYETEQPRTVLVGWDTLGAPTYRQRLFPDYQSGRVFDEELVDQLEVLPQFVAACGFANAKSPGYEADDFLAAAVAEEERRQRHRAGRQRGSRCVSARLRRHHHSASAQRPAKWRASAPRRCASAMASSRTRCLTSSLCVAILPTNCLAPAASDRREPQFCCANTVRSSKPWRRGVSREQADGAQALQEDRDDGCRGAASRSA